MNKDKNTLEKIEDSIIGKLNPQQKKAYEIGDKGGSLISNVIDKIVNKLFPEK